MSGRSVILQAGRALFGRIIVMAQGWNLQMADVLSHPLGPLPWALATAEGLYRKTNKAALVSCQQNNVAPADQLPDHSTTIIDGMSIIQKVKGDQVNFGEIAQFVLSMALKDGSSSDRIDIVFDTYQDTSIKNCERLARGEELGLKLQDITASQIVRQWRSFLAHVGNKSSLISFLVSEWRKPDYTKHLNGKVLFVTTEDHGRTPEGAWAAKYSRRSRWLTLPSYCSCCTDWISSSHNQLRWYCVFIMALAFHIEIESKLFQKCGAKERKRIIDITKIAASMGADVCHGLIGMHAYTGCDTVSTFADKGKLWAPKLLRSTKEVNETFAEFGKKWNVAEGLMHKLENFTCLLFASKYGTKELNSLRYSLFWMKGGIESHQLPPWLFPKTRTAGQLPSRNLETKPSEAPNDPQSSWKRMEMGW